MVKNGILSIHYLDMVTYRIHHYVLPLNLIWLHTEYIIMFFR